MIRNGDNNRRQMCFVSESHCFPFDTGGRTKKRSTFERIVLLKTTGALNFLPFALNCSGSISKWDEMNFNEHNGHFCDYEYHSAFISDTQLVLVWPN